MTKRYTTRKIPEGLEHMLHQDFEKDGEVYTAMVSVIDSDNLTNETKQVLQDKMREELNAIAR